MPMKNFGNLLLACMAALLGACAGESAGKCDAVVRIDADSVVNRGYIGNGVQWDPYALDYGQGRIEISDADWAKLYARLTLTCRGILPLLARGAMPTLSNLSAKTIHSLRHVHWCASILAKNAAVVFSSMRR